MYHAENNAPHDDDQPIGRILSRREVLKLFGTSSIFLFGGLSLSQIVRAETPTPTIPTCVVQPELTEGPYFVDEQLNRMDIRIDPSDESVKVGIPLHLVYRVSDVTNGMCVPLQDAQVDIWQCDAEGIYSGVEDTGFNTEGEQWLRGYQVTDEFGVAEFLTIVPGWYSGRAVHIHFKIRTLGADGENYEFTSQFFFDPEQIEQLYMDEAYVENGLPDTPNDTDFIYQDGGDQLTLMLEDMTEDDLIELSEKLEETTLNAGYKAIFDIGLDLSDADVGASDSIGSGLGSRGGGRP